MKPTVQSIIDKQRLADHRLKHDKTTRSGPELAHYERALKPVPLTDVELPKLPMVRMVGEVQRYVLLGEIGQIPGTVLVFDPNSDRISQKQADQMELVPAIATE